MGRAYLVSGHPEVLNAVSRHHMPAGRRACSPGVEECTCVRGRERGVEGGGSLLDSFQPSQSTDMVSSFWHLILSTTVLRNCSV